MGEKDSAEVKRTCDCYLKMISKYTEFFFSFSSMHLDFGHSSTNRLISRTFKGNHRLNLDIDMIDTMINLVKT